jgi:hypothetical protein
VVLPGRGNAAARRKRALEAALEAGDAADDAFVSFFTLSSRPKRRKVDGSRDAGRSAPESRPNKTM